MANTPTPRSYQQILGGMLNKIASRTGVSKLQVGGNILSFSEAAAQSDYRNSADTFMALSSQDLDNATGQTLDSIGLSEELPRRLQRAALGYVSVTDSSFTKVSGTLFHGRPAPIAGSSTIYVGKGSSFDLAPTSGNVYLGRGTVRYEGPLSYSAKTDLGPCWSLTVAHTVNFHNQGESVILAQGGDRTINFNQPVVSNQGSSTVTFSVTQEATIQDGDDHLDNIQALCSVDGTVGNLSAGALNSFGPLPPFPSATVTNLIRITSGRDVETDNDYRDRIRQARGSRQRGIDTAIQAAVIDVTSMDEPSSILSATVVRKKGQAAILCIDDGNGYEEKSDGVGFESLADSASGQEDSFLTAYSPVAQAYVEATNLAPWVVPNGGQLGAMVGGDLSVHYFDTSVFTTPLSASAYDVVSSINADATCLFQARVTQNGSSFAIFSKTETNDDLKVIPASDFAFDCSSIFGMSTAKTDTTDLYKNDILLSKDGVEASILSGPFGQWSALTGPQTLIINVDGTGFVTYNFTDASFQALDYPLLSNATPKAWAEVINSVVPGITAVAQSDIVTITSNRGRSSKASLAISGGTLASAHMFPTVSVQGVSNDYSIDRAVGAIALEQGLAQGDSLSLGSKASEGFLSASLPSPVSLVSDSSYEVVVDAEHASNVPTPFANIPISSVAGSIGPNSDEILVSSTSGIVTVPGTNQGDWISMNDTAFPASYKGAYRNNVDGAVSIMRGADIACRMAHTSTSLPSSLILLVGGCTSIQPGIGMPGALKGRGVTGLCSTYDPAHGVWTQVGSLITPRAYHTATLMPNGKVFISGGFGVDGSPLSSTEIFDPTSMTFSAATPMPTPRAHHSATLMGNGMILLAGGVGAIGPGSSALSSTIAYNPPGNLYQSGSTMGTPRYGHQAVCLDSAPDEVFVFGGISSVPADFTSDAVMLDSAEVYTSGFATWNPIAPMTTARAFFGAANLSYSNRIVVAGNGTRQKWDNTSLTPNGIQNSQVYTPSTNSWSAEIPIVDPASGHVGAFMQGQIGVTDTNKIAVLGSVHISDYLSPTSGTFYFNEGPDTWYQMACLPFMNDNILFRTGVSVAARPGTDALVWFGGGSQLPQQDNNIIGISNAFALDIPSSTSYHVVDGFGTLTPISLASGRLIVTKSDVPPTYVKVPSNGGYLYTAQSMASLLDSYVTVKSAPYRLSALRLSTRSTDGSIFVADQDLPLPTLSPKKQSVSQKSQYGYSTSASGTSNPSNFQVYSVGSKSKNSIGLPQSIGVADYTGILGTGVQGGPVIANGTVVGMRNYPYGMLTSHVLRGTNVEGSVKGIQGIIGSLTNSGGYQQEPYTKEPFSAGSILGLRSEIPVMVANPVMLASPFKFGVTDPLNVTVDGDYDAKRFSIPMARKLAPTGSYGSPLSLSDSGNSGTTISSAFGTDYDFNDFALLSRARVISDYNDPNRSILWRYYRFGEEGNNISMRYVYPDLPSQPVSMSISGVQSPSTPSYFGGVQQATVDVCIGSGPARQNRNLSPNSKFGVARGANGGGEANSVWNATIIVGFQVLSVSRPTLNGDTELLIMLPSTADVIADPGIIDNTVMWYNGTSPSSSTLRSGQFVVKGHIQVAARVWLITIQGGTLDDGSVLPPTNYPGTISFDPNQEAKFDDSILVGDLAVLKDPFGNVSHQAMRITDIGPTRQYLSCQSVSFAPTPATVPNYAKLNSASDFVVFPPLGATAANMIVGSQTDPISGTLLSDGTGTIVTSTWDQMKDAEYRLRLTDGVNYVLNTNKPANKTIHTTFDLKIPVSDTLTGTADFSNEEFYLVPQLTKSVVQWLNTPAITGLWSVASIDSSSCGTKVQIKTNTPGSDGSILVEGGAANSSTAGVIGSAQGTWFNTQLDPGLVLATTAAEAQGLVGGSWVELKNEITLPKVLDYTPTWGNNNNVVSVTPSGVFTFSNPPYACTPSPFPTLLCFEKVGRYATVSIVKSLYFGLTEDAFRSAGNWLMVNAYLPGTISASNCGFFKILKVTQNETVLTYWIENEQLIEEQGAYGTATNISSDSPVPGDFLLVNDDFLGLNNKGSWKITDVKYDGTCQITVDTTVADGSKPTQAFTGSVPTLIKHISIVEGIPAKAVKQIVSIFPNSKNVANADVLFADGAGAASWQESAGTVISALDKLGFDDTRHNGTDAYRYNTGLIAEAKRVVYGDPADTANYPGYAAGGAQFLFQGPSIKRIKLTLQIRLTGTGISTTVSNNVISAVTSVVNGSPAGVPLAISEIIKAAQNVDGVSAVSMISPTYNSVSDKILIRGLEKAKIIDSSDISVLVVGS